MSQKARKDYTSEQTAQAVQIVLASEQSIRQVARDLGRAESTLSRWVRQPKIDSQPSGDGVLTTAEGQELKRLGRENKQLEMERDFLTAVASIGGNPANALPQKGGRLLCQRPVVERYQFMVAEQANFSVSWLCRQLQLARSGFYAWLKRTPTAREFQDQQLAVQIQESFERSWCSYGSPRIHHQLRQRGFLVSRKRVIRLMQQQGLVARRRRRCPGPQALAGELQVAPHLLQRQFHTDPRDQCWVGEMTYLPTPEGWRYLAV